MRTKDIIQFGGMGLLLGFYGITSSKAMEYSLVNPTSVAPGFMGFVYTLLFGGGNAGKVLPYLAGLIAGQLLGFFTFNAVNPDYVVPKARNK